MTLTIYFKNIEIKEKMIFLNYTSKLLEMFLFSK